MPIPENMHYKSYNSLHQKLADVIEYEECVLELFKMPEADAVYMYKGWRNNNYADSCYNGEIKSKDNK